MSGPELAYESDTTTVWFGRAEDVCQTLETESVDLVVTDPPYGIEYRSGQRSVRFEPIAGDTPADRDAIAQVMSECVRVIGQDRHLYVFGPTDILETLKVGRPVELIWDKTLMSGGSLTAPYGTQHERISFCVSKHRHAGRAGVTTLPARIRKGSILRYPRPTGRKVRHPTEKPVGLLRELIESSSRQGEVVFDPYAGIGSTGVAAALSARRSILVECHQPYVELAVERIKNAEALSRQIAAA